MKKSVLYTSTFLTIGLSSSLVAPVLAQTSPAPAASNPAPTTGAPVTELDAVSVTATRGATTIGNVTGTVSVIEAEEIERRGVKDIRDLTRYEPGVTVSNNPARAGLGSFTIRGIGGNRVLQTIDGARIPDFPANGQPGTFTRDTVDTEVLKRVEIVRGPGSSLYGSDAIGGVVAYETKDPSDFLNLVGKDWYAGTKYLYDSANHSNNGTSTVAARVGKLEVLGLYTRREGDEFRVEGVPRRGPGPNPQEFESDTALLKFVANPTDADRLRLTGEFLERRVDTIARTEYGLVPLSPARVVGSDSYDTTHRYRVGFDHLHDAPIGFIDKINWRFGYQEAYREEDARQSRFQPGGNRFRQTERQFEQDLVTADIQFDSKFEPFGFVNNFTYGVDYSFSHTRRYADRSEFNLQTRRFTKTVAGETFPNRTFPITDTDLLGGYVQDRMEFFNKRLEFTPGVRVDYYNLSPRPDPTFQVNMPDEVGKVSEIAVSPKAGLLFHIDEEYSVYGNYARGFRSPPYDDANIGFNNAAFGYRVLPNTNLNPETSDGFEAGFRGKYKNGSSFSIAGFYNIYHDFIQQTEVARSSAGIIDFQSRNLNEVTIHGVEARGELRLLYDFSLLGSLAYSRGKDEETGNSIDTIDPLRLVAGLRYHNPSDWGAELLFTWVDDQERLSRPEYFYAPSYETLDLTAFYNYGTLLSFNAGIRNLADQRYFVSQDVIGLRNDDALLPLYAQPGRTFFVSAALRW